MTKIRDNVRFEFTPECIWELFLLMKLPLHLPKFWHAGYDSVVYFLHTGDLGKVLESVYPKVTLISDKEAILNVTGWNDWNGLLNATFSVIRTAKGVRFHNKKIKRLVPYNCGICY